MRKPVDPDAREAVAAEVRSLMGRTRTSQKVLALAMGVGQSALSDRLTCKVAFDLDDLVTIARHFDVPVTALLPRTWDRVPPYLDLQLLHGQAGQLSFDDNGWSSASPRRSHLSPV